MRKGLLISIAFLCLGTAPAMAQYSRGYDPCQAPSASANSSAILALASVLGQSRRDQACAAERRAQWDEYNARQKAAKVAADAAAAKQHDEQAQADRHREEAAAQQAISQTHARRQQEAAEARAKRARVVQLAQTRRDTEASEQRRRLEYVMLVRAENAPDNHCREPDLARGVMQAWNGLDTMKDEGVRAIDIEHVTTVSFDPSSRAIACHGVFVTSKGWRIVGTATVKKNVAGDPMFVWQRDASQDLAAYDAPAAADAGSPEMARQVTVQQTVGPATAPIAPATASQPLSRF